MVTSTQERFDAHPMGSNTRDALPRGETLARTRCEPCPTPRPFRVGSRDPQKYIYPYSHALSLTSRNSHRRRPRIVVDHEFVGNDADTV